MAEPLIETCLQVYEFLAAGKCTPNERLCWSPKRAIHELAILDEEDVVYITPLMMTELLKSERIFYKYSVGLDESLVVATPRGLIKVLLFVE